MSSLSPAVARNLWIGAMVVASTVTTLVLACATPFPALAALAALHVRRAEGVALVIVAWLAAQITGFGLLHYPVDANSIGWALALGIAAIGSLFAADIAAKAMPGANYVVRLVVAYAVAYIGFKAMVLLGAFALQSGWAAFKPEILTRQFVRYGLILVGLVVFQRLLSLVGVDGNARPAHA
ncbi:MAG: hypothetical protein ABW023_12425 [Sphingomonas sp.]